MPNGLRILALVDLLRADSPEAIGTLAADDRLDRRFDDAGPLFNRMLARRIRHLLRVDGVPLPPVAARDSPGRAERQAELEAALEPAPGRLPCDETHLEGLTAHVLGRSAPQAMGPLVQEVVGRLFLPDFRGTAESWDATGLLDAAVRSFNPLRQLVWLLTGRVERARRLLAERVGGDPAALHSIGIAVHNLVRSFERMRELAAGPDAVRRLSTEAAVAQCLAAPDSVLRQAVAPGATTAGSFRRGTIVLLELEAARARSLRRDVAFMTGSWSRCPAHRWVPALLAAVWDRVAAARREEGSA
jgi:hypothetical protein